MMCMHVHVDLSNSRLILVAGGESTNTLSTVVCFQCKKNFAAHVKSQNTNNGNAGMYFEYTFAVYIMPVHVLNFGNISLCSSIAAVIHSPSVLAGPLNVI